MVERRNRATAQSAKPVMIGFFVPITSDIFPAIGAVTIVPTGNVSSIQWSYTLCTQHLAAMSQDLSLMRPLDQS
ncbi:MAG: hypothetical protein ACYDHX_12515, partial [Methanothrix sp.]